VKPTSSATTSVEQDIPLTEDEDALTRRILRATLVDNVHSDTARVQTCIMHQRRATKDDPWQNVDSFNLAHLKAGQEVRLRLSSEETERLYQSVGDLYAITNDGIPRERGNLAVVDEDAVYISEGKERDVLLQLLGESGDQFWALLEELEPNAIESIAKARLHATRERAFHEFEARLQQETWTEGDWERFFRENTWIFGHGLSYRFLSEVQGQAHYGGTDVTGRGGQRGDFLMASQAVVKFTVLVDIKKPQTPLLNERPYRNRAYAVTSELSGGVAQLQSNCRTWAEEGSKREENRDLEEAGIYSYEPKGILIIGSTTQLDHRDKRSSFELYRRHLTNPEILTFDEILERARFLVTAEVEEPQHDDFDDLSF
jgi:hypothetical protein